MLDCTISCFTEIENTEDKKDTANENRASVSLTGRSCIWMFPTFTNTVGIIAPASSNKSLQLEPEEKRIKHDYLTKTITIHIESILKGFITSLHNAFRKHKFAHN